MTTSKDTPDNCEEMISPHKPPLHHHLWIVKANIEMKTLWDEFNELGTEMIVTKAGRLVRFCVTHICAIYSLL